MSQTQPVVHEGKITNTSGIQITMICKNGVERLYTLSADARITCFGKPTKPEDLRGGIEVRVTECENDNSIATCVSAGKKRSIPYA